MRIAAIGTETPLTRLIRLDLEEAGFIFQWFPKWSAFATTLPQTPYSICLIDLPEDAQQWDSSMVRSFRRCKEFLMPLLMIATPQSKSIMFNSVPSTDADYIIKPASSEQVLTSMQVAIDRVQEGISGLPRQWGDLSIDYQKRSFFIGEELIHLTRFETALALHLIRNMGQTLSRDHLIETVWAENAFIDSRKVDVHVCSLRRKLKLTPPHGWRLASIYGKGYQLERLEGEIPPQST
jgi:DNA-binding response OmpR family regulator